VTIAPPTHVNLTAISNAGSRQQAGTAPPIRNFTAPPRSASQRFSSAVESDQRSTDVNLIAGPQQAGPAPTADFPMMNLDTQVSAFGVDDEGLEPPDTQVAAGPTDLVEAVNDTLSVWSKTGTLLMDSDLNTFFPVPSGYFFGDPRVLYDASSGLFFLSGWASDANDDSQTYLAVSSTSDPTGSWTIYTVQSNTTSTVTDQPMTGICDDKVVVAWNQFAGTGSSITYQGAEALVLQKSVLTAGTALTSADSIIFSNQDEFRLVPAQALSASTTCYMAVNNASTDIIGTTIDPTLGVIAINGTPDDNDVTLAETDLPITATSAPPDPTQPGGTTNDEENDDRMLSAVWQDNQLWTSLTDACVPPGDNTVRNCMRLDEVNTSAATPTLSQNFDLATPGLDEYYPAVSLDSSGDLFVAYSASSSTQYPGAYAVMSPAGSMDSFTDPTTIQAGSAAYTGVDFPLPRWGDYSAAAPDPSVAGAVWVAGEYAPSDASAPDWGTAAAELSLPAGLPAITSDYQTTFNAGTAGSFTVSATGTPAPTLAETGTLPSGVTFTSSTALSGTPAAGTGGIYPIEVTATNSVGTVTQTLTLIVQQSPPASAIAWAGNAVFVTAADSSGDVDYWWQASGTGVWHLQTVAAASGGVTYGNPAIVWTGNAVLVTATDSNGNIDYWWQAAGTGVWHQQTVAAASGGVTYQNPKIVWAGNAVFVTATDSNGNIDYWWQASGTGVWHPQQVAAASSTVTYANPGMVWTGNAVLVTATDNSGDLDYWWQGAGTGVWHPQTVAAASNLATYQNPAIVWAGNAVFITAADNNGNIDYWWQGAGTGVWNPQTVATPELGLTSYQHPAIVWTGNAVLVTATDNSGGVDYWWQGAGTGVWNQQIVAFGGGPVTYQSTAMVWTGNAVLVTAGDNTGGVDYWWQASGTGVWNPQLVAAGV
jgi:hypothetical protein